MKMINSKHKKLYLIIAIVMLALITGTTIAWLSYGDEIKSIINPGDFYISTHFYQNTNNLKEELVDDRGVIHLNGLSENDYNNVVSRLDENEKNDDHINNLNISIKVKANIAGYLRVKVMDEWIVTKTYPQLQNKKVKEVIFIEREYEQNDNEVFFPFILADGWVYDEVTEYCYYGNIIDTDNSEIEIPFITSGYNYKPKDSASFYEICTVNVSSIAEMVQANRFASLWGINEIPKEVANG